MKSFSGRLSFTDSSRRSSGGALRYSCYSSKTTLELGSAMGKWNSYAVIVTQGVSNPNDRLGFRVKTFLFVGRHKSCTGRVYRNWGNDSAVKSSGSS